MTKEELFGGKSKPRICEVLGVEVNEEWVLDDPIYNDIITRISADGDRETKDNGEWHIAGWELMLVEAINHPEKIKRLTHWTAEERKQAKAIKTLFPSAEYIQKRTAAPSVAVMGDGYIIIDIYDREEILFNTLKDGEIVTLGEILEAENNERTSN